MKSQEESKSTDIENTVNILRQGGVVVFPTDTVYGIGCRFDRQEAVARIQNIKKSNQHFPLLISDVKTAHQMAIVTPQAQHFMDRYWPGALTLILEAKVKHEKIGLRLPDSDQLREIIDKVGVPIVGTSANFHGQKTAATFSELDPNLVKLADFVVRGTCKLGKESTVVDATFNPPKLVRQGAVKIR